MKKRLIQLLLIFGLMVLTCAAAQATETEATSGFRNVSIEEAYKNDVSLIVQDSAGRAAKPVGNDTYPGAAKVGVVYNTPHTGSEYLLIVLSGSDSTPSVDNMAYIDQKTASTSSELEFTIYPKKVDAQTSSVSYSVYLSSNTDASTGDKITGYVKVGSFEYYSSVSATLGDVDGDERIMVGDAVLVLQAVVGAETLDTKQTAAADVDKDGRVMVGDAVAILQYVVGAIKSFDEL